jgi:hypothetical protein
MSISLENPYNGLDFTELSKDKKLFIALPLYVSNLTFNFFVAILKLQQLMIENGLRHRFEFLTTESLITRGRNTLVAKFVETDYTHFLFIDSDLQFNPEIVYRFLAFDEPITCGIYPKKQTDWEQIAKRAKQGYSPADLKFFQGTFVLNHAFEETGDNIESIKHAKEINITPNTREGFVEVAEAGTGFMMIKREVFDKMKKDFPEVYTPEEYWTADEKPNYNLFFDTMLVDTPFGKRFLSEDYAFCLRAKQSGYKIWADMLSGFGHGGFNVWYGTYAKSGQVEFVKK